MMKVRSILHIKIQIIGETDEVIAIEQILKEKFTHLSICRSHANFLEVMHKSATKGNAVRFLEDYFHVKMEECVASAITLMI